jgi:2,4-diaminopentanoate dehydrogenase
VSTVDRRLRVVQWTTGKVARESLKTILERPGLELVGVYAWSKEKAGQDAGDLAKIGRKLGIKATSDIDEIIAMKPDCVVYMPLHPDVEQMARLLRAGVNIATSASFMTGRGFGEEARRKLEDAAQAGKASLFGSGINPGWVDNLTATAAGLCREVNLIRIVESFNIGLWAADANQDVLGWGRPAGDPGHARDVEKATLPFGDAVEAIARMFHFELDEVRCEVEFAHATRDAEVPGRTVKKGTVAGIMSKWLGISGGHPVMELIVQWTVAEEIDPPWEIAMAYLIEVNGTPQIKLRAEVLPEDMTLPMEELMTIGFMFPALPVVNAIPGVVAARPGIVTYADLKPVTSVFRPRAQKKYAPPLVEATPKPVAKTAAPDAGSIGIEGKWNIVVKGPTGPQATELVIERKDGQLGGAQSGQGMSSPISDVSVDGNAISWVNHVTKPMKLKVTFTGTFDGATMTGKCKAGFLGSYPFTGTRA